MLYERIKRLCKEKGVSVTDVERDLGFGRGSLSKIDKHKPSNEKIKALADYFEISQDSLTGVQQDVQESQYYVDQETLELAEELFRNRELHVLMDAAKDVDRESLAILYSLLLKMKKTNDE